MIARRSQFVPSPFSVQEFPRRTESDTELWHRRICQAEDLLGFLVLVGLVIVYLIVA